MRADLGYGRTSAGPEDCYRSGIMKAYALSGEYSECGPILDGKKEGYWTKKYKDVERVSYYLCKNGVPSCYVFFSFPNGDPRIKYSGEPRANEK